MVTGGVAHALAQQERDQKCRSSDDATTNDDISDMPPPANRGRKLVQIRESFLSREALSRRDGCNIV